MVRPKILELIDAQRIAKGMTREEMAGKMQDESGESWDKEKLDKAMTQCSCPRAETVFLMMKVLGMPCWPWEYCQSIKGE